MAISNEAKLFGGRALKGSARQCAWAEELRAEKLKAMTAQQAEAVVDPNGLLTHAKFWVKHRNKSAQSIGEFALQQKRLLAQYRTAND